MFDYLNVPPATAVRIQQEINRQAANPTGWTEATLLDFPDTREFTNPADTGHIHTQRVIIVQTTACPCAGDGCLNRRTDDHAHVGMAIHYLHCTDTTRPLTSQIQWHNIYRAIASPADDHGSDTAAAAAAAAQALAEFDPATLHWDGNEPPADKPRDPDVVWVKTVWPYEDYLAARVEPGHLCDEDDYGCKAAGHFANSEQPPADTRPAADDTTDSDGEPVTHKIERTVLVYLTRSGDQWAVSSASVDGYSLDTAETGTTNRACACEDPVACEDERVVADLSESPTGTELIPLLAQAAANLYDEFGPHRDAMPQLSADAGPLVALRDALRADARNPEGSELSRHTLALLFNEHP